MAERKIDRVSVRRVGKGYIVETGFTTKDDEGFERWENEEEVFLDKTKTSKYIKKQVGKL